MQTISNKGIGLIKSFEACKLQAYQKKGDRPTIGWGNTYYEDGTPVKLGDSISQIKADQLFLTILHKYEQGVNQLVKSNINQNQFDALVCFAYNVGLDIDEDTIAEGLGDSTLLKKVNSNPNDFTIRNEFMKWVSKGTIFEKGLTKRRKAEADLYFS